MQESKLVLVTGATRYIGGRLVLALLEAGCRVRCLVRDARRLQGRPWSDQVEVVEGDALTRIQPMAIGDVLRYLVRALGVPERAEARATRGLASAIVVQA